MKRRQVLIGAGAALLIGGAGCRPKDADDTGAGTSGDDTAPGADSEPVGGDDTGTADTSTQGDSASSGDSGPEICAPSPAQNSGTYYLKGAPQRQALCDEAREGEPLVVRGRILDEDCQPVAGARVEVWHAEPDGGYTSSASGDFRGVLFTDADGAYLYETRVPGYEVNEASGAALPLHIHYKVVASGFVELITMLYFSYDPVLTKPGFDPPEALIVDADSDDDGVRQAALDVVITRQ